MVYDGYATVLTGTMPVTLTQTLLDMPDGTTGLVHLGNGRYYDPALGRPLQPNPAGAPPTVSQALNRYTATPVGQPGVFQAANQPSNFVSWAQQQAIKTPVGELIGNTLIEPRWGQAFRWGTRETGWLRVQMRAERRFFGSGLQHLEVVASEQASLGRRWRGLWEDGLSDALSDGYTIETRVGRVYGPALHLTLADAVRLDARVLERETARAFFLSGKAIAADLAIGIALDVAFQIVGDWNNPYLTTPQFAGRVFVAGVGGAASSGTGLATSGLLILAGVGSVPAVVVGLGVGLFIDWWWASQTTPSIYESFGLNPIRSLQPLVGSGS